MTLTLKTDIGPAKFAQKATSVVAALREGEAVVIIETCGFDTTQGLLGDKMAELAEGVGIVSQRTAVNERRLFRNRQYVQTTIEPIEPSEGSGTRAILR